MAQKSSDGTIKWLIQLLDGNKVECVFIPEKLLTLTKHTETGFVLYDYPNTVTQAEK